MIVEHYERSTEPRKNQPRLSWNGARRLMTKSEKVSQWETCNGHSSIPKSTGNCSTLKSR